MLFRKRLLPDKRRQAFVGPFIQSVREEKSVAGEAPVVIAHKDERDQENGAKRYDNSLPRNTISVVFRAAPKPAQKQERRGQTKNQAFVRTSVRQKSHARSENESVAQACAFKNSCERAKHESTRTRGDRAAPIAVHPVAGESQLQRDEHSAKKRPARGHPCAKHPINCCAHRSGAQQNAKPGRAKNLSERENSSL